MSTSNVLKHLVVDSGAIIKEVNMVGIAENLWTVSDVLEEIRDKRARRVLENLPKELKVREPSATSIARVVEFAKKTGDLRSLSTADLRVLALAYMLEVEENGSSHLRKEPMRVGTIVKKGKDGRLKLEKEKEKNTQQQQQQIKKDPMDLVHGLTVIVRGLSPKIDEKDFRKRFSIFGTVRFLALMRSKNGKSRGFGFVTFEKEYEAKQSLEMNGEMLMRKELKVAMWIEKKKKDDDVVSEKTSVVVPEIAPVVEKYEEKKEVEENKEKEPTPIPTPTPKLKSQSPQTTSTSPFNYASAVRSQKKVKQQQHSRKNTTTKKVVSFNARALMGSDKRNTAIEEKLAKFQRLRSKINTDAEHSNENERKSHILGPSSSLVKSVVISKQENEEDNEGWIDPSNVSAISMASLSGKDQELVKEIQSVGCITLDFAMQNVLTQIGLHVVAPDGRVIRRVKQWVLQCSACFKIEPNMSKLFCSKCGHNTLRKLGVTLRKDGTKQYHYSKKSDLPQRGSRYSIPKRKGGRKNNDILLCEDQLLMGEWRLKAGKKSTLTSQFGEGITESLGMRVAAGTNVEVGYGRKNPNSRRGRERRGAKKKNNRRR